MIRLFVDEPFEKNKEIILSAPQSHYLVHVMRQKEGSKLFCFNGYDGDWEALLSKQKKEWFLLLQKQVVPQQKRKKTVLCVALIKREPLALILQKTTELGVSEIHLIQADRSNNERVNMERLKAIIVEACEQCERNDLPVLFSQKPLSEVMNDLADDTQFIWLAERGKTAGKISELPPAFFIGPEGGWSEKEQALFQKKDAFSWHLGDTVLRAETAAITALALWQYQEEIKKLAI